MALLLYQCQWYDSVSFRPASLKVCTKKERIYSLKVKLNGLRDHGVPNCLSHLTMTEELETGPNHVIETIHRFLNSKADHPVLPPTMYVQLDKCSRDNKNPYMFAHLKSLVP